ncbi:MAG TPA: hypothetical protein VKS79_12050 [Gemmataceae bacterium]|nr:hypothetical protein [Gemmataceae bacterium]
MNSQLLPPEDCFWDKYSPHFEFSGATVVSVFFHATMLILLFLGVFSFFQGKRSTPVEIEPVVIAGGPGKQGNSGGNLGSIAAGSPVGKSDVSEEMFNRNLTPPTVEAKTVSQITPKPVQPISLPLDERSDPFRGQQPPAPESVPNLAAMLKGMPDGKAKANTGTPGKPGQNGTGTPGTGVPGGKGYDKDGTGTGAGILSTRQRRQLRWTTLFSTVSLRDYLQQLQMVGALLGVQYENREIRMLAEFMHRPARLDNNPPPRDRIFWMDDKPESVRAMTSELQLKITPWRFIAFFPESLEKQLLEKELAYGKRYGRNSEDQIQETVFRITFLGNEPRIEVVEQH